MQLIIDSFEKTLTLENTKLKLKPEDYIFEKIVDCWKNTSQVYGYFTTVCQSSGFGKSRACQNLSTKAYVVYCCLRSNLSKSGYPKRSYLAKDLTEFFPSEQSAREYFICYFNMFFHFLNQNPSISQKEFFKKFSNGFDGQSTYSEHYELILQSNCSKTDQLIDYVNIKPLVFVFDEASSLLKPESDPKSDELFMKPNYFILRSLISEMNRDKQIFVLFLDTFSSLSSFMPSKWFDPSQRASQSILIEPIYLLPNWDVFVDIEAIKTPKDSMTFENICSFGRPLWGSLLTTKKSDKKYNQISCKDFVSLAKGKLVGGGIKNLNEFIINDSLAILSCRIGTIRPLLTSTCQDLVAKNMAVCTYANYEKNIFKIEYPSEPFLSNAAAAYFNETISTNKMIQSGLFFLINNLNQAVLNSIVDQGDKGETISKILLLKAYDASVNQLELDDTLDLITKYCSYIKVECFIKNLYGRIGLETIIKQLGLKESNKLLNGFVRFNHFVLAKCSKEKLNLKNLIKRCCAIQCVKTEPGVDFVIPVIYSLDESSFERMSVILVQTKLHATITPIQMDKLKKIQICRSDISIPFLKEFLQKLIFIHLNYFYCPKEFISKLKNKQNQNEDNFDIQKEESIVNEPIDYSKLDPNVTYSEENDITVNPDHPDIQFAIDKQLFNLPPSITLKCCKMSWTGLEKIELKLIRLFNKSLEAWKKIKQANSWWVNFPVGQKSCQT
ncbi:hypothetical protein BpHYR1_022194 [Brachionus plicatilis]|uniref:Uncharacterized protein n=1 Tax=Brachionus plicatilis TaxID=10195 RepID=A0A3M7P7W9_BRAPC|nr:hypothetical protein BpHYR1_022194 [Brachionus plicatilis]